MSVKAGCSVGSSTSFEFCTGGREGGIGRSTYGTGGAAAAADFSDLLENIDLKVGLLDRVVLIEAASAVSGGGGLGGGTSAVGSLLDAPGIG